MASLHVCSEMWNVLPWEAWRLLRLFLLICLLLCIKRKGLYSVNSLRALVQCRTILQDLRCCFVEFNGRSRRRDYWSDDEKEALRRSEERHTFTVDLAPSALSAPAHLKKNRCTFHPEEQDQRLARSSLTTFGPPPGSQHTPLPRPSMPSYNTTSGRVWIFIVFFLLTVMANQNQQKKQPFFNVQFKKCIS